jgi:hypothetical protein
MCAASGTAIRGCQTAVARPSCRGARNDRRPVRCSGVVAQIAAEFGVADASHQP